MGTYENRTGQYEPPSDPIPLDEGIRVIFLDIDGVLISTDRKRRLWKEGVRDIGPYVPEDGSVSRRVDPECVKLLLGLVKDTGAKIVISSVVRSDVTRDLCTLDQLSVAMGLNPDDVIGTTPHMWGVVRGHEIAAWFEEYEGRVKSYVCFDDGCDYLDGQPLVRVNSERGITPRTIRKAKCLLGCLRQAPLPPL